MTSPAPQEQPPPYYAYPPPPAPPKRKIWPWIVGGLAVVVLACCGIGAVTIFSGDDKTSNSSSQPDAAKDAAQQPGIGTPVRDGKFEFTVQKVECGKENVGSGSFDHAAQGQFCLVTMSVKNIGAEPQTLSVSSQKGFGSNGAEYSTDLTAGSYTEGSDLWLTEINPGNQVSGTIVFDMPKDVELVKLELHDSSFSDGVEVQVK